MRINELLNQAVKSLKKKKNPSAYLDAEVLLSHVLKQNREYVLTHSEKTVTNNQIRKFKNLVKRRLKLEPIAYLIKKREFHGINFYVDQRVLIPRPETEILVETVLESVPKNSQVKIADIGTGSGCIAITLAKHLSQAQIIASDISKEALAVARENARKHQVAHRIKFIRSNLLKTIKEPVNIIVANLPYLSSDYLTKELKYEPLKALVAKKQGRAFLEKILIQAAQKLAPGGKIFLEIHPPHLKYLRAMIKTYFVKINLTVKKDLAQRNRVIIITTKKA